MTRFSKIILAAALGGTAIAGTAYAAQDQSTTPATSPTGMHRHHRGHGDMFAKLDANHDGVITRDEAIAAADARFAKDDTNGDGKITKDEIEAKHAAMRAKWQQRRAAQGGDSAQSPDGAPQPGPRGRRGDRHGHRGDMMQRLDTNSDGVVIKAEAEAAATARFDKLDTNHDGKIDHAEIAAAKQQMQARMSAMRAKWQARRAAQGQDQAQPTPTDQPADQ